MSANVGGAVVVILIDDELKDLAIAYLETRKGELEGLEKAGAERDFAAVESLAHKIKGTAASYGFTDLTRLGDELEEAARRADQPECLRVIAAVRAYVSAVEMRFESTGAA